MPRMRKASDEMSFLYEMIYPEIALSQEPVFDHDYVVWGGPDRKGSEAPAEIDTWRAWLNAYKKQSLIDHHKIPRYVDGYFQEAKKFSRPPTEKELDFILYLGRYGIKVEFRKDENKEVKEVKNKNFTWSYSALSDFESCPYSYAEKRIYKRAVTEDTEEIRWGRRVHEALEAYLKGGEVTETMRPYFMYAQGLLNCPKDKLLVENKLALGRDFKPVSWFDRAVWGRGVIDVAVLKGDLAMIYDWKTGKVKDDQTQLKIFCCFLAHHYPELQKFQASFIFLKEPDPRKAVIKLKEPLTRKDLVNVWGELIPRIKRMEDACRCGIFPKKTSGLCRGWCPVKSCEHYSERR